MGRVDETEMVIRRSGSVMRKQSVNNIFILAALLCLILPRILRRWHLGAFL
jgi:hypothetical protein